jgi:hypothetical protein
MKRFTYLFAVAALLAALLVAQVPAFAGAPMVDPDSGSIIVVCRSGNGDFSWGATSGAQRCSTSDLSLNFSNRLQDFHFTAPVAVVDPNY